MERITFSAQDVEAGSDAAFFGQLPSCVVVLQAWDGAHIWRHVGKLEHDVPLIPLAYVKPFAKRQETDAADAGRPAMPPSRGRHLPKLASLTRSGGLKRRAGNGRSASPPDTPAPHRSPGHGEPRESPARRDPHQT